MKLRFDAMLHSNVGNENSDASVSNVHVGRRLLTPGIKTTVTSSMYGKKIG